MICPDIIYLKYIPSYLNQKYDDGTGTHGLGLKRLFTDFT